VPPVPHEEAKEGKPPATEGDAEELDLGMSRDVPTDPETGVDDALKIGYRVVTGTYNKAPIKAPPAKP
jgi:hypothetical protein